MSDIEKDIYEFLTKNQLFYGKTSTSQIVFRDEFIEKCQANHCGQYHKKWSCPPAIGDITRYQAMINTYQNVVLFSYIGKLDDNYDVENMDQARKVIMTFAYQLKTILDNKHDQYMLFGAGSCELCQICAYPNNPCKHPELLLIPLEALGIDVYDLSKKCGTQYYNGPLTVTYFCAIVF